MRRRVLRFQSRQQLFPQMFRYVDEYVKRKVNFNGAHSCELGLEKYVKRIGDEKLTKVPADLDLKPYRDEHDLDLLRRMADAVDKGHAPAEFRSPKVRRELAWRALVWASA